MNTPETSQRLARAAKRIIARKTDPKATMRERWYKMKARCYNPTSANYSLYGARGISMCDEWRTSFDAFYRDMGPTFFFGSEIDRINNDGNYEPGNCRWATPLQSRQNTRLIRYVTILGIKKKMIEWMEISGLPRDVIRSRIKRGWPESRWLEPSNPNYCHAKR